ADVSPEEYLVRDRTLFGDPDDIAEALSKDVAVQASTELLVSFPPAVPALDEHLRLLTDTATRVAAPLGWIPLDSIPVDRTPLAGGPLDAATRVVAA
ncbi:MAG: alkane 1-monooxygenase, partial [Glaciihabitans sp.]|nr:alkane 1-monooxygenase [Glaciihabitans sp.]